MKIFSRPIDFSALNKEETLFNQKLDKCPDKQAKIQFWMSYKVLQPSKITTNKTLMIESNYTTRQNIKTEGQPIKTEGQPSYAKKNSYVENNLFSNRELSGFVEKLQKKSVRTFTNETEKRVNSKSIEKNDLKSSRTPSVERNFLNKIERKQTSLNEISLQIKNNLNEINTEIMAKSEFLQRKIDSLTDQMVSKSTLLQTTEAQIASLKLKNKSLQLQNRKLLIQNSSLNSSIERLEDKLNLHKERYQSTLINQQNQMNRWNNKQKQYQESMKSLTQKIALLQFQKQRIRFDSETNKLEEEQNHKKVLSEVQNQKKALETKIKEINKQLGSANKKISQLERQNAFLQSENEKLIEKINLCKQKLETSKNEQQILNDIILHKNVQIERLEGKLLLYTQTLETQKMVIIEMQSLKSQLKLRQNQIHLLKTTLLTYKNTINQLNMELENQKQLNRKLTLLINEKQIANKKLQEDLRTRNQQLQNVLALKQTLQCSLKQQKSKLDKKVKEFSTQQLSFIQEITKKEKQIENRILQVQNLEESLKDLNKENSILSSSIKKLSYQLTSKSQIIDQIFQIIDKFQQNLLTNKKLSQIIDKELQNNFNLLTQKLTKSRQLQDFPQRVKKTTLIFQDYLNKLVTIIENKTEKNNTLQSQLTNLTQSIQKMHAQTIEQSNQLKGNKLTLQEKLQANEKLVSKMKLMSQQKDKQIISLNKKLQKSEKSLQNLKLSNQSLQIWLKQSQEKTQTNILMIKKLNQQVKSTEIVHKQVQRTLTQKLSNLEAEYQTYKNKQITINKTKSLEINDLNKKIQNSLQENQKLSTQIAQLKQLLTTNKIHVQKINTLFVDVFKQINYIEKESKLSSFLFTPLRDAVKKVQMQISPKFSSTNSNKGQKQRSNNLRSTSSNKTPPPISPLSKSPQSKISVTSKGSKDKRQHLRSKETQKI